MEELRNYRIWGTPDFPVAMYRATAGDNMKSHPNAEYHPEPEISWVSQGNVTMQINGSGKLFCPGDIFIIPPNAVHRRTHYSEDTLVRTVVFSTESIRLPAKHFFQKEFVHPLSNGQLILPEILQPGHPAYETVVSCIQQMAYDPAITAEERKRKRFYMLIWICTALMPYCSIASDEVSPQEAGSAPVRLCIQYIRKNYQKRIKLDALAALCHLHPNYLCTLFKRYTGETVFEYLNHYRVEIATQLLHQEDLPANKVAELVGFHSECQFFQKFKEHTGCTPRAYRKQLFDNND